MAIFYAIFTLATLPLLVLFIYFCIILLQIFAGKSLNNPNFPPVKGTVFHLLFNFKTFYDFQARLAKTYPTFRILLPGLSVIYTTDPRNIEHVLKANFERYSKGKVNQEIMVDLFGDGIFIVDGDKWRHQRKLVSLEFSTRVLRDFSCATFRRNAIKLITVVSQFSDANLAFDIQDILMKCTLDSIFKVGFGMDLNCLEGSNKKGNIFSKAFDDSSALVYWRYVDPFWKIKRFFNIGCEASLRKNIKIVDDFVNHLILSKRKQLLVQHDSLEKEDILSRFITESEKDPEHMNDRYLRDIILNFIIAGKDTTANTLSWFFYMLSKHPLVQEKVAREAIEVIANGEKSEATVDEFVEKITDSTLDKMHYLHAALSETLRLYPAVPTDGRNADADDVLPDGYRVKTGDGVFYLSYGMGRMTRLWGEDAEDFRPERWLKDGIFQPESPFKFIAFHAGPRICLGKDFAYRQMKIISIALLRFFRFRLDDDTKNVTYRTMFTLHIDGGLHLRAISRDSTIN